MTTRRCFVAFGALLHLMLLAGCKDGPDTGEVSGVVKVDGEIPPPGSSITFIPADGKSPSAGATLQDGRYTAQVPVGLTKVEIRVPRPKKHSGKKSDGPGPGGDIIEESLPDKYNNNTELTIEVKRGYNQKDWELSRQ